MGLSRRTRSGNILGGSKLNVPGQGIYNTKLIQQDKVSIGPQIKDKSHSRPTPTPTPVPVDICYLSENILNNLTTEYGQNLILDCDDVPSSE